MLNHVTQHMTITGTPDHVREVIEHIKGAPDTPNELFDLNAIVPMPDIVRRTAVLTCRFASARLPIKVDRNKPFKHLVEAQFECRHQTGHLNWYYWSLDKWGTTCNVFAVEAIAGKQGELCFKSHETPIVPALLALSKLFPPIKIQLEYIDEGGRFIGRSLISDGELEYHFYGWDDPEAQELRARLWAH